MRHLRSPAAAWLVLLGVGAVAAGVRGFLLHTGRVAPSPEGPGIVYWSTVGLTGVAVLLLLGELLTLATGSTAARREAVHRLPAWLCLVAVVVLGSVTLGHDGARDDERTLTPVLAVQLLMTATAVVPAVVHATRRRHGAHRRTRGR